ncbi:MAG: hypothetical protein NZ550_06280 [Fimbriimonadales bacterium]|nr:hypothetical protein [Fimbriimonadales bacterium]MDW8052726.1 hypothetical protein [Armatimonadota bacterium]
MRGRWVDRWAVMLWALWLSLMAPSAAWGCLQACQYAPDAPVCCNSEPARDCSSAPCECEPCPVCGAPELQPALTDVKPVITAPDSEPTLTETLTLLCTLAALPHYHEPPQSHPLSRVLRSQPLRAPPVLR